MGMIQKLKVYRVPIIITLTLMVLHFWSKDITNPYQKPIAGDAEGYYAYLPALFIYQDLDYSFTKEIETKHYVPGRAKSFVKEVDGQKVNKTFPGVALLYLPFFLMAHALAILFGLEADGYSFIYQLYFDMAYWFYFLLGMIFSLKILLKLNFNKTIANWSVAIVVLGTNIVFYTLYDLSVTHIHNLFLISAALYFLLCFKENKNYKNVILALIFLLIAGITRPTNIIALVLIVVMIPDFQFYKALWLEFRKFKNILQTLIISFSILAIPLLLWKAQTGHWIVYSYGEEGFNFGRPEFLNFIISYTKGWITYSPIVLLILIPGFILLFKQNKLQFGLGIIFYLIAIYLFSSWWCWYYGAGMGQRVMIDFSILLMFLLGLTLKHFWDKKLLKLVYLGLTVCFIGLNFVQAYQIKNGIITFGSATEAEYWDNFLSLKKKARVYPFDHWELKDKMDILTQDHQLVWTGDVDLSTEDPEIKVSAKNNYSAILGPENFKVDKGSKLIFSFEMMALTPLESTRLIIKLDSEKPGNEYTFYLKDFEKEKEWIRMEFMVETTDLVEGPLKLFFWNGKTDELIVFKNIQLSHYYSGEYY